MKLLKINVDDTFYQVLTSRKLYNIDLNLNFIVIRNLVLQTPILFYKKVIHFSNFLSSKDSKFITFKRFGFYFSKQLYNFLGQNSRFLYNLGRSSLFLTRKIFFLTEPFHKFQRFSMIFSLLEYDVKNRNLILEFLFIFSNFFDLWTEV